MKRRLNFWLGLYVKVNKEVTEHDIVSNCMFALTKEETADTDFPYGEPSLWCLLLSEVNPIANDRYDFSLADYPLLVSSHSLLAAFLLRHVHFLTCLRSLYRKSCLNLGKNAFISPTTVTSHKDQLSR